MDVAVALVAGLALGLLLGTRRGRRSRLPEAGGVPVKRPQESVAVHVPTLKVLVGPRTGELFAVSATPVTIGREAREVTLSLPDAEEHVSRVHCEVSWDENERAFLIQDVGSKNGTLVDGCVICMPGETVRARSGCVLQLGGPAVQLLLTTPVLPG